MRHCVGQGSILSPVRSPLQIRDPAHRPNESPAGYSWRFLSSIARFRVAHRSHPKPKLRFLASAGKPSWEPKSSKLWDAEALREHMANREMDGRTEVLWRIGNAYKERGDYRSAIPPYRECLAVEERVLGPEHPATLDSVYNLASLLEDQGDYNAAEALFRRALTADERTLGADHPKTLTSVNSLANVLAGKEDYGAAEPLYRRAVETGERVLGPEHLDTLTWLTI
jgi:tetratricopeptide (TPR) repeat protein